jgi:hypothetical protein
MKAEENAKHLSQGLNWQKSALENHKRNQISKPASTEVIFRNEPSSGTGMCLPQPLSRPISLSLNASKPHH